VVRIILIYTVALLCCSEALHIYATNAAWRGPQFQAQWPYMGAREMRLKHAGTILGSYWLQNWAFWS